MPGGPCPLALALTRVPSKRWSTRADLAERLTFVHAQIIEHCAVPFSNQALADMAALSPDHFLRTFRETFGITPSELRGESRMCLARKLIEEGSSPSEAAWRVGYVSLGTFSRRFRAKFGVNPSAVHKNPIQDN